MRILFISSLIFFAACNQQAPNLEDNDSLTDVSFDGDQPRLEFFVDFGEHGAIPEGKILGEATPSVEKEMFPQVDANPTNFIDALAQCGELRVLFEQYPHGVSALVPVKENNPMRAKDMNDLELVNCFKKKVSFSFNAAIKESSDRNFTPFESLHAQKN